jgi:hypothetical protein
MNQETTLSGNETDISGPKSIDTNPMVDTERVPKTGPGGVLVFGLG